MHILGWKLNQENPDKIMKTKTESLFLALGIGLSAAIMVAAGCATSPDTSSRKPETTMPSPTWSGDKHDPPVYTSPATPDKKDLSAPP